jgi:CRP/FNR family cyclic AMP-dependent transcriptional regulator
MNLSGFLHSVPELARLPNAELERLEKAMTVAEFPDGYEFIREGERADDVFLLIDGQVSVSHRKGKAGRPMEIKRLGPGEFFGLIAPIDHGRRAASCKGVGPVRVASLPRSAFVLLYHSDSRLSHDFLNTVAHQLTRDFRALTHVLRNALFDSDDGEAEQAVRDLIRRYSGPERRTAERRKSNEPDQPQ